MGELLTTGQVARALGVSPTTVRNGIRRGELRCACRTHGGHARIDAAEVERFRTAACGSYAQRRVAEFDYRLILNHFTDAVVMADESHCIVYVNAAAERLLGWPTGDLIGQPLTVIVPPRLRAAHTTGFAHYISTHVPKLFGRAVRVPALRRDGAEVDIELTLTAVRDGAGGDLIVASLRDLRERVEMERQMAVMRYVRATTKATAQLASQLDLQHVLQTVVEMLVADFDAALARAWLYDAATDTLDLRASAGLTAASTERSRAQIEVATDPYIVSDVARTRAPFIKNGIVGDPRFEQEWVAHEGIAAVAAFPLLVAGALHGVLMYFSRQALPDEVVEVLTTFVANQVAIAIRNAHLYKTEADLRQRAEAHARRMQHVQQVGERLKMDLDEFEVGNRVAEAACEALGFRNAVLNLVDRPGAPDARARVVATAGIPPEGQEALTANDYPLSAIDALFRSEFLLSRSYFIPEGASQSGSTTEIPVWTPPLANEGPNAWRAGDELPAPLTDRQGGHLLGFLSVDDPESGQRPEQDAVEVLEIFADQAVVALRNARLLAAARRQAEHDPVTGLLNHRTVQDRLEIECTAARTGGQPLSLLALDMDDFKLINDTHGHQTGDMALRHIAGLLERCARAADILARLGGDEFLLILPGASRTQSLDVARRLSALARELPLQLEGGEPIPLRLSVGVAAYPNDADQPQALLAIADARLYEAKRAGGRTVEAGHDSAVDGGPEVGTYAAEVAGFDILSALVTAVDNKDRYTREHSEQVASFACALADALGLSHDTQRTLRIAGLLHDVGKIGVPDRILRKPGKLELDEWTTMRQHVALSTVLVRAVVPDPDVLAAVAHHHERWDGKGYPQGLAGTEVPLLGRIMILADAVSAMAMDRPYRKGLTRAMIVSELRMGAGVQFDPALVEPLIAMFDVKLSDVA